jgi:hypothetical protein
LNDPYGDTPTPEQVWQNLETAVPNLPREQVSIQRAYSNDLQLPPDTRVRFAHIDGGHDAATVSEDLALCAKYLIPGGVMTLDDYAHPQYPGVTAAVNEFLRCQTSFRILADLNRSGALGRKLYLARNKEVA